MTAHKANTASLSDDQVDQLVLTEYPYPIAVNYRRLLESQSWEACTRKCIEVFEYGLRTITLGVLSQYLIRDVDKLSDTQLDKMLHKNLPEASLGRWNEFFWQMLRAYGGRRELFFMPKLYDLHWDISYEPHRKREGVRGPFDRMVQIRNELAHRLSPNTEDGWQVLGEEALGLLRTILARFSFLQDYDLIQIKARSGDAYEYERYTGEEVTTHCEQWPVSGELHSGWFYLARQDRSLLVLHPLLIFWTDDESTELAVERRLETAVYERLLEAMVEYAALVMHKNVRTDDSEVLAAVRELIYYNLEHVKMGRKLMRPSWQALRDTAKQLTGEVIKAAGDKYLRSVYLQRHATFRTFQDYLTSDKSCFVLVGKSGVGKSNFVFSLDDEFAKRDDVALLVVNAARLTVPTNSTVVKVLGQKLAGYLTLREEAIANWLAEIDRQEGMSDRKVIIIFDAINENADGKNLLRQIDQMVGDAEKYPWLKIVITSRPQAWKTMKRGVTLADGRYYHERGKDERWVEMEEFTVKLEPFRRQELPEVYEKYRREYELQLEYAELEPAIRDTLRDPLVLRLVAEIYEGQVFPEQIQVSDIYGEYVDRLLCTECLLQEDLIFLQQELMPLMLSEGHYDNEIRASQVSTAKTQSRKPLWELIFSDDPLGNGQAVNASYARLVDAEILVQIGSGQNYAIRFQYERFYEFFGGQRLCAASQATPSQMAFYQNVAKALPDRLFLWGALVEALARELQQGKQDLFTALIPEYEHNPLLENAMAEALVRFGERDRDRAEQLIKALIGQLIPPPGNILKGVWRLLRPVKDSSDSVPSRQSIAVQAASRLKLIKLLEDLAAEPSPNLRTLAQQQIFYLWKEDPPGAFRVLDGLSRRVVNRVSLPDLGVAESLLGIIGAILGREHTDEDTLKRLLDIGRRSLRSILYLGDAERDTGAWGRARRGLIRFLYGRIISAIMSFVIRIMGDWGEHAYASKEALAHVFELPDERKALLATLIPFLDNENAGLKERVADMIAVEEWGDALGQSIVELSLLGYVVKDLDGALAVTRELTEYALRSRPPCWWVGGPVWNVWQGLLRPKNLEPGIASRYDDLMELFERVNVAIQEDPRAWSFRAQTERPVPIKVETPVAGLGTYIAANYTLRGGGLPDLVSACLDKAIGEKDTEYVRLYVTCELPGLLELGLTRVVLMALEPVVNYEDVREDVIELLVRVWRSEPEIVDDWLRQGDYPKEIVDHIQASPTTEGLIDMVTMQLAAILYDLFILGPKPLRIELQWLISQALKLPDFDRWLILMIKELINLLVGEEVFQVPADAPSKEFIRSGLVHS